jgi:subtilisin family serine protease
MRKLLPFILILCSSLIYGQHSKVNLALKLELQQHENSSDLFPLFVMGNTSLIIEEVERLGGEVVRFTGNIVQAKLPIKMIESFSRNSFVESIPYSFSKGKPLSDTMTIHNNVTPIHNGVTPLLQAYTGKGVVFGIIDTGHDIVHPDFKDTLGNTRIYRIWDQISGLKWDSASINNATCTHNDYSGTDHGTHVSGIGAGNGLALNMYAGVAGEATIVAVASDFNAPNWLSTVVDAADYIYAVADSLGMPCVINASIGDYFGSHDGTDPAGKLIDSLVNYKPGRAFVCAAGNAGFFNWHVEHNVNSDTTFTWLKYNASSSLGFGSVFYEVWSDTLDFNNVDYAFGANLPSGTFEERGRTPFFNIKNRLGTFSDTIKNGNTVLAIVETYAEIQDDKYLLQVLLNEPDSNTYNFSILSTGSGRFDFWSTNLLGTSPIVETGLPTVVQYPPIAYYVKPDSAKTTVSSFTCSPNILTVANFVNRKMYVDVDTITQVLTNPPGMKGPSSSLGPDRRGNTKPDIGATGDATIGPNSASVIAAAMGAGPTNRAKVALGGMHRTNGGTSMASPVVAGVVALYLEKCPNATMAEVKSAILNTANQDAYTGAVPNNAFGFGKIDAFAALNNSNFSVSIAPDRNVCYGDSVQIAGGSFASYLWSNNDTSSSIYIDTTTQVYLTVTNTSGCISISDTIDVTWRPLPTKPVITVAGNDTLIYSSNLNLQWYYNNNVIPSATDTLHQATSHGDYFVEVTDSFGCKNNSDTVNVIVLGIENNIQNVMNIFPNPANSKINLSLLQEDMIRVELVNSVGKILKSIPVNKGFKTFEIDMSLYPAGMYFVKSISSEKEYVQKLILLR